MSDKIFEDAFPCFGDMPEEEKIYELSDFFKVLGDSTRINILLDDVAAMPALVEFRCHII